MAAGPILLFSYGTLQQEAVQRAQFGRLLTGSPDALIGFTLIEQPISDPAVVALSGSDVHPNLVATGDPNDRVAGTVFELSEGELLAADAYEVAAYRRIEVRLQSGLKAWVYAKSQDEGPLP